MRARFLWWRSQVRKLLEGAKFLDALWSAFVKEYASASPFSVSACSWYICRSAKDIGYIFCSFSGDTELQWLVKLLCSCLNLGLAYFCHTPCILRSGWRKKKEDLPTISLLWHLITDHIYALYFFYRKRKHLRALQPHTAKFLQYSQHTSLYLCCVLGAVEVVVQEKNCKGFLYILHSFTKDIIYPYLLLY